MIYAVDVAFFVSKQFYVDSSSPEGAAQAVALQVAESPVESARGFEAVLKSEVLTTSPLDILDFD